MGAFNRHAACASILQPMMYGGVSGVSDKRDVRVVSVCGVSDLRRSCLFLLYVYNINLK